MADDNVMDQSDIEQLLESAKEGDAAAAPEASEEAPTGGQQAEPVAAEAAVGESAPKQNDAEKPSPQPAVAPDAAPGQSAGDGTVLQGDVDYLLKQAEQAIDSINSGGEDQLPGGVTAFRLEEFSGSPASTEAATLDLIRDVELDMKIELGRTHMYIEDVLRLRRGSVVALDKLAGDPVDVFVNGRLIARGEVLVLNDNFCVRVTELISGTAVA